MIRGKFISLLVLANTAQAQAPEPGTRLGTTPAEVSAALQADGFELTDVLQRQSLLRVSARRDGERHEFRITMGNGNVVSHKVLSGVQGTAAGSVAVSQVRGQGPGPMRAPAVEAGAVLATSAMPSVTQIGTGSIAEMLAALGYQLLRAERQAGRIEAYATRDNRIWELKIDAGTVGF